MADPGYHRILERQLRRLGLSAVDPPDRTQWTKLLEVVSTSYQESDADRYTMERSVEISSAEMRALHEGLSRQATHDTLTGLPNRSAFTDFLNRALAARRSVGGMVAVLFVDLDDFKLINDSLGHSAGDELLARVAGRIREAVRANDVVARLGGDEFVVACVDIEDLEVATAIAHRIAAHLETPFRTGVHEAVISASIGIASTVAGRGGADDILREADMAMYEAKAQGRSRYVIFDDEMHRRLEWRLATENALRHAVEQGQLRLNYQPIVCLADRRLLAIESLVRWERPGYGLVMPQAFIPIAEQTQLITAIDAWVIRTACEQAASWGERDVAISVNLSARDLRQPDIAQSIATALAETGLAPRRLIVEITETTLVVDDAAIAANLARIRRLGVGLAIDDFGTGYSSFASLRRLPARTLKIDRSFVSTVEDDESASAPSSTAIIDAIITMGHALGLTVVAEGVEYPYQVERLRELGCDAAQGYVYGGPGTAADFDRYFETVGPDGTCVWPPDVSGRDALVTVGRGRPGGGGRGARGWDRRDDPGRTG
jgi:diguanylate cyclase (GGDEF)-like protein